MRTILCLFLIIVGGCVSVDTTDVQWQELGGPWHFIEGEWQPGKADGITYLVSTNKFRDVRLQVEFQPDAKVNSGLFLRCQDPEDITASNCYEANIWDNHPKQEYRTGAIVTRFAPPLVHVDTIDRWNLMQVEAIGNRIQVRVNDELTAELEDDDLIDGYLAIQWGGEGTIRFRNLRVESN